MSDRSGLDPAREPLACDGMPPVAAATPGSFDELRAAPAPGAAVAPHWRALFDATASGGRDALAAHAAQVQRRVREDGATYTVHAHGIGSVQAWPLQVLPFIVPADEWPGLATGVRQRARLLNATLADLYGAQALLREAVLPPALVYAHPQYLRPLHGVAPAGGVYLHLAAFDLARGSDGTWRVLAQRLQAPSGLGYLLQNRLILAQALHEAHAALRVQRLGAALQTLVGALRRLSPAGERAHIVLLTPGPAHETWFEQVFLARQFGLTLAEGGDLTVRGRQLFLKTMQGLQRVHVVLRRVDDDWIDPLELRADSALGVPGLLQVLRAGEVVIANVPGAGVLESPGLAAFWPGVARRLLGEELLLAASTHWWCGEANVWRAERERLEEYVVAPTFPPRAGAPVIEPVAAAQLDAASRAQLLARIDADPAAFTLQSPVQPSHTPVWQAGSVVLRPAVLRLYAIADGRGDWCVLPGGLTRIAAGTTGATDPWLSMQHGSVSADTWVLAEGEALGTPTAGGATLTTADLLERQAVVSSRAAENLFWLGRYTERAEFAVALVRLAFETLHSVGPALRSWLDELVRRHDLVDADAPAPQQSLARFERALARALPAASGRSSVGFDLRSLATCAGAVRERLSPEHWRLIEQLGDHFEQHIASALEAGGGVATADVAGVLGRAATHLAAVTGAQTDRMLRDDGWRLLSVGRQLERIDTLGHALARGLELRLHESDEGFDLLLALFDCGITYRARFQTRRELLPLAHLLVADLDHPRSLAWVARTLRERLRKLARHDAAWAAEAVAGVPAPESWPLEALACAGEPAGAAALAQSLHRGVEALRALSDAIGRRLFAHVDTDHAVWQ